MKLVADASIELPFTLHICARGPNAEPLVCTLNGHQATLYFPPSLAAGTDGQGMFGDWAWWTGRSLRLVLERDQENSGDAASLRAEAVTTGNEILRRFLNAYRWRLGRAEVHPVRLDPDAVTLELVHADGRREALPDPVPAFLRQNRLTEPPLGSSVNATTLAALQADVQEGQTPPVAVQLLLDAEALEGQGEPERAALLRRLSQQEQEER